MFDFEILDEDKRQQLAQEKLEARRQLQAMPPEKAQEKVASFLSSDNWSVIRENLTWNDPLPITDDSTDS